MKKNNNKSADYVLMKNTRIFSLSFVLTKYIVKGKCKKKLIRKKGLIISF